MLAIHRDSFQSRLDEILFDAIPDVHILTADEPIVWGDLTLESARWRVIRWILDNLQADWVIVLGKGIALSKPNLLRHLGAAGVDDLLVCPKHSPKRSH